MTPRSIPAACLLVLGLLVGACSTATRGPTLYAPPFPPPQLGAELTPFAYITPDGAVDTADAGTLLVPENRSRSTGRSVRLVFVRLRSTSRQPGPPLVYLAGGPGSSGIDVAGGQQLRFFEDLRAVGDVILLDQRGTGRAEPSLRCAGRWDLPALRTTDDPATTAAAYAQAEVCARRLRAQGVDLGAYTTPEIADDVEALRRALGVERLNLYGFSSGSHFALAFAQRHPTSVHRLVLGGVEGPGQTYKLPSYADSVLARLDARVGADPRLARYVPDLLGLMDTVHARLRAQPVIVRLPLRQILRYEERGFWRRRLIDLIALVRPRYPVLLGEHDLQALAALALGRMDFLRELPSLYHAMAGGDFQRAALYTLAVRKGQEIGTALTYTVDCADGVEPERTTRIAAEARTSHLGQAVNWPFPEVCGGWGELPDLGGRNRQPLVSDVPVLMVNGDLDGRTPLEQAADVLRGLPNGRLIVVENAAHSANALFLAPEVRAAVLAFLRGEPVVHTRVTLAPVEFAPPVPFAASLADTLFAITLQQGVDAALARYRQLRERHGADYTYDFSEPELNDLGYRLVRAGHAAAAVVIFRLNAELYPRSLNVYDSLGEGYIAAGDTARALESLRRATSLGFNPHSYRLIWQLQGIPEPVLR